jgi:hypothetical protein
VRQERPMTLRMETSARRARRIIAARLMRRRTLLAAARWDGAFDWIPPMRAHNKRAAVRA